MLQTVIKDFYVARKQLLPYLLVLAMMEGTLVFVKIFDSLTPAGGQDTGSSVLLMTIMVAVFPFFGAYMAASEMGKYEERTVWASFAISSPLGAKGAVTARYYETFLIYSFTLVWVVALDYLNAVIFEDMTAGIGTTIGLAVMCVALLISSFQMAMMTRFGAKMGALWNVAVMMVIMLAVGLYLLFGDLSIFGTREEFLAWLEALLQNEDFLNGLTIFTAIAPLMSLVIFYLSCKLSCRMFCKGVESYEQ